MMARGGIGRAARALAALVLLPALLGAAPAEPRRIVSINPCIDAVLLRIADPRQIAGISHYSLDPRSSSVPVALARRFRATGGSAEEVVALAPDLVIASGHVDPSTVAALDRMGVLLLVLDVPATIAQSNEQIRRIARVIGRRRAGEALVGQVEAARARAGQGAGKPIPALIWGAGGLVPGAGTLADDLLRASGFANLSADYGVRFWGVLGLEPMVARPPRVLLTDRASGERLLQHPVLKGLQHHAAVRDFPMRLIECGGPTVIDALDRLAAIRRSL